MRAGPLRTGGRAGGLQANRLVVGRCCPRTAARLCAASPVAGAGMCGSASMVNSTCCPAAVPNQGLGALGFLCCPRPVCRLPKGVGWAGWAAAAAAVPCPQWQGRVWQPVSPAYPALLARPSLVAQGAAVRLTGRCCCEKPPDAWGGGGMGCHCPTAAGSGAAACGTAAGAGARPAQGAAVAAMPAPDVLAAPAASRDAQGAAVGGGMLPAEDAAPCIEPPASRGSSSDRRLRLASLVASMGLVLPQARAACTGPRCSKLLRSLLTRPPGVRWP